jgi:spore germination cell wall hydrolase CwlJ-like protein
VTSDDFSKAMLALVLWREARNQSREGIRAVGHVIRNRVNAGWGDWIQVITAKNQFTSISHPGDPQLTLYPRSGDAAYLTILSLVDGIYDGSDADLTSGALYYWNPQTSDPQGWFASHIVADPAAHPQVAAIGAHVFYA